MSCLLDQLVVLIDTDFMLGDRDIQRAQTMHLIADGRDFASKFITSAHITELGIDELENTLSDDLRLCDLSGPLDKDESVESLLYRSTRFSHQGQLFSVIEHI